ncbi:MAG: 4Fe-4S dicluster domain-containing protein [Thermoplasmatota archaeon]
MVTHAFFELLKQFFSDPATNLFPVPHAPQNVHRVLKDVEQGRKKMIPPVDIPPRFRGKIMYDREACIGCQMCIKVCPSQAIEFIPDGRKVKIYVSRCTFCELCTEICPKKCLKMSEEFLMANLDKYGEDMIVLDSGNFTDEGKKEEPEKAPEPPVRKTVKKKASGTSKKKVTKPKK